MDDEFGCLLIQSLGESLNVSNLDGSPQLYTLEKRRLVLWPISCFACLKLTLPVEVVYVYIGDDEGPLLLHKVLVPLVDVGGEEDNEFISSYVK